MAIWQFECMIIPKRKEKENYTKEELISWHDVKVSNKASDFLFEILPCEKNWSKDILQYGKSESTCIEILLENNEIEEIDCRLDVRNLSKVLMIKIIEYINIISGEILYNDNIYEANVNTIVKLIKESDAAKFWNNPQQYFENIESLK